MGLNANYVKGKMAEAAFDHARLTRGLMLSRPAWDIGYDRIVHNPITDRMWRVGVKTTTQGQEQREKYPDSWTGSLGMGRSRGPN